MVIKERRKMKKRYILMLIMITTLLFTVQLFGGGQQETALLQKSDSDQAAKEIPESIVVTDSKGREVTVNLPVNRIAFSHFSTGEALRIVDAWDLVVGRDNYTSSKIVFPGLEDVPCIATGQNVYNLNCEKIYELDVDLFIAVDIPIPGFDDLISRLEPDIPVVALNFHEPSTIKINLEKLGQLLGRTKEVEEYVHWYDSVISELETQTGSLYDSEKVSLFYKTGWGGIDDIQTFSDSFQAIPERNRLSGSINIAGDLASSGGWVQNVDSEWLMTQDVDVLIVADPHPEALGLGVDDKVLIRKYWSEVLKHPLYSELDAIKNERVYMFSSEFFGTPRFIIGAAYLAKWCHPNLFKNFSPQDVHQEYLSRFMRIDYDLNEHGVFVYP